MKPKKSSDVIIVSLVIVGILLIGFDIVTVGSIIACAGALLFLKKKDFVLAGVTIIAILALIYIAYMYVDLLQIFSQILMSFLSLIFLRDAYYSRRVRKTLEKIMRAQDVNTADLRIEILSFEVTPYYRDRYNLETPVRVKIWVKAEVIKGFFDVKTNKFVDEEPVLFPVYTKFCEKAWRYVGSIHKDGTPKKVEFRNKYEGLVGVDVYNEIGLKTEESWRLHKSVYEKWNPVKREWEPQRRGWKPKKSVFERLLE